MRTREELVDFLEGGGSADYLLFWGHTPKREDAVCASCLSQWFPRAFTSGRLRYATAEHFMMAEKARLFGDAEAARRLGPRRFDAVVRGNVAKFGQHEDLSVFLRSTNKKVLVEASPRDRIWGIGMGAGNPDALVPARWRGRNLLGFALMEARAKIAAS